MHGTHHKYDDLTSDDFAANERHARRRRSARARTTSDKANARVTRPPRAERDQAFKCRHCKQFIGMPMTGGRHRNHCPNCLYSRHVDLKHPGDRRSGCHSLMQPVGCITRRNGEQVIIHRCLGCGKEDPNRIAADDNPALLMTLPLLKPAGLRLVSANAQSDTHEESA